MLRDVQTDRADRSRHVIRQVGRQELNDFGAVLNGSEPCLSEIDRLMEDHRFLAGEHVSLADLMVIPLLFYFGNVPDGRAPMAEHPKLQNWVKQMETRQSFQVTKPPAF